MPRAQEGVWVEFDPDTLTITRLFSSENVALRSAVKNRADVTKLPYGKTLEEWIAERDSVIVEPKPARKPRAPRVAIQKPAAEEAPVVRYPPIDE
ncbi:MAG: hypothetical protein ACHQ16_08590 [Candidatus Lutacidiplasmatales archaeon]|jgi:hypothetical protein